MNFGWHLKRFNLGMMTALMPNPDPDAVDSTCINDTNETSEQLLLMLDFESYITDGFNFGIFMESFSTVNVLMTNQFQSCGVAELYIRWDNIMSHISDVCGMVVNISMAVGLGWTNKDTYPYLVWDHWVDGWNHKDFYEWGLGF